MAMIDKHSHLAHQGGFLRMRLSIAVVLMLALTVIAVPNAHAQETVVVQVNHGRLLNFSNVDRVVVAAPDIADVNVVTRNQIMIIAKKAGETTLSIWNGQAVTTYRVVVVSANASDVVGVLNEALGRRTSTCASWKTPSSSRAR